jgi:hypothetical protein
VLVVQVDAVGAQPTQRVVDGPPDAVRPAAQAARLDSVLGESEAELGGDLPQISVTLKMTDIKGWRF